MGVVTTEEGRWEKIRAHNRRILSRRLPGEDSNLETRLQRPMCYHYTTGQTTGAGSGSARDAMLGSLLGSKINASGVYFIFIHQANAEP